MDRAVSLPQRRGPFILIPLAGVILLAVLTVLATGFSYPFGAGWTDELFDAAVIFLCPLAIVLAAAVSGRDRWPSTAAILALSACLAASMGQVAVSALLWIGYGIAFARLGSARRGAPLSGIDLREFLRTHLAFLCLLAAVLLLFEVWEDLSVPGGLRRFAGEFGGWGVVLSLFLLLAAANLDALAALLPPKGWDPARRGQSAVRSVAIACLCFAAFLGVNALTRQPAVESWDSGFSHAVYRSGGDGVNKAMKFISSSGGENMTVYGLPLLGLILLLLRRGRSLRFYAGVMLGTAGVSTAAKALLPRMRPDLVVHRNLDSFPSGHTISATVLAGVVLMAFLPMCRTGWQRACLWVIAIAWPILMASSRVYLGRHYLTDVLGGLLLGLAWVSLCRALLIGAVHLGLDRRKASQVPTPTAQPT